MANDYYDNQNNRPLCTLTVHEFKELMSQLLANPRQPAQKSQAFGIRELSRALTCSTSQISKLRKEGVLDAAVISHLGRRIVFDIDKAREDANKWFAEHQEYHKRHQ